MSGESPARRGRPPSLTATGKAWALGGALLVVAGGAVGSWPVTALGTLSLGLLGAAYLAFYPTSILVWRRHLELRWHLERPTDGPGFVMGRPFRLRVTLCNRSPRALGRAKVRVFASSALEAPAPLVLALPARHEVTVSGELTATHAGTWFLHGAAIELTDRLGLSTVEAYFPSRISLQVLPRPQLRGGPRPSGPSAGAPHERLGLHALRRRGLGGDLRELREHAPGDPFKQIAWKATARTGTLMVRDLDRETLVTHALLIDVGPSMRRGPGPTKLDLAVELAQSYARAALEAGDRVGLITWDARVIAEVRANDGPVHRLRLLEPLLDASALVDEDLTEVTDSELIAGVARYLALQEGVEVRLRHAPPIDDPLWSQLASSPEGELYDLRRLHEAVGVALEGSPVRALPRAATGELARLRLYCKLRGIELPYRSAARAGQRAHGLAQALERAAAGRGAERIVVLSDLDGLEGPLQAIARAVRLAQRRGVSIRFGTFRARREANDFVDEILAWDTERQERAAARRFASLGVRVAPAGALEQLAPMPGRRRA
jgi:uncharacterized protein (DUF58 family)